MPVKDLLSGRRSRTAVLCVVLSCAGCSSEIDQVLQTQLFKGSRPPVELASGDALAPGDELYMTVSPRRNLYLYVVSENAAGERLVIYPCRNWSPSRPLGEGRLYRLPPPLFGRETFWPVGSLTSRERLRVIAGSRSIDFLESAVEAAESSPPCASPVPAEASRRIDRLIEAGGREVWISTYELKGEASLG